MIHDQWIEKLWRFIGEVRDGRYAKWIILAGAAVVVVALWLTR